MATRKTTTRPKTKTAKTTRTPRTASASAQTAARRTADVQVVKRNVFTTGRMLGLAAALYLGLAVAAGFLMQPATYSLSLTHLTNDLLLSQQNTAFVGASRPVFDLELRWVVVGLMLLSTALPVLYLTRLKRFYAERLATRRVIGPRWVDLAVSSALMVEVLAILVGYSDVMTLKLMGALLAITCYLGWRAEVNNEAAGQPNWNAFGLSVVTGALPWVAIVGAKIGTMLFSEVRAPWYVYAACLTTFIGFLLLAWNQWKQHRRAGRWADYIFVDRNYLFVSTLTKVAFAAILIVGLSK